MKRRIPTFDELKLRHQLREEWIRNSTAKEIDLAHGEVAHQDAGELIKMCDAILHLHKPDPKDIGKCPLALYFATDAERDGFVEAYRAHFNAGGNMAKLPDASTQETTDE